MSYPFAKLLWSQTWPLWWELAGVPHRHPLPRGQGISILQATTRSEDT